MNPDCKCERFLGDIDKSNNTSTLAVDASAPAPPIRVEALMSESPDGPVRAWVVRVDLTDPRVSFVVTGPLERREGDP